MKIIAVYNVKGGVGKTTTAINLSYLSAASGRRTLLWDLDPQGASSFAFRVQADESGFDRKSVENGHRLAAAIKETDYHNLHLLPADFAYRKFERFLDSLGQPDRLITRLLDTLGRDYDTVFLDCPAGFSLLVEGIFAAADAILVPSIPTVLSLRMVARLIEWADRFDAQSRLTAFFNMVDRRKSLHRQAVEWSAGHRELFLAEYVPYASVVEQMAARRVPLSEFAPREPATAAFTKIHDEIERRLEQVDAASSDLRRIPQAIESLIARIDSHDSRTHAAPRGSAVRSTDGEHAAERVHFVHTFDTERRDLEQRGHMLQLLERSGRLSIMAAVSRGDRSGNEKGEVQIDGSWARQILSGTMSPLSALERRLGPTGPRLVDNLRAAIGVRELRRIDTRVGREALDHHSAAKAC